VLPVFAPSQPDAGCLLQHDFGFLRASNPRGQTLQSDRVRRQWDEQPSLFHKDEFPKE
jgi:hypothetical protein